MQNSIQKTRRINLVGVINHHDDPDEENLEIINRLGERLDDPGHIMVPGDIFRVRLPGNRLEYYIVYKNVFLIGEQQAYDQTRTHYITPPKRLDYSGRGFHREYDPNDRASLYDLEFEIIEDFRLDYSIEPGHVLEVNIGGEEGQSPIIIYYKVVRGLLNIEPEDVTRSRKVREGFNAELEEEDNSQSRGGRKKKTQRKRKRNKKTNKKKTNRKKHTKKRKKKSKKHTRKRGGVRPLPPEPLSQPVMNDTMDRLQPLWTSPHLYSSYINEAFQIILDVDKMEAIYREGELGGGFFRDLILNRFEIAIQDDPSNWDVIQRNMVYEEGGIERGRTGRVIAELRERNIMAANVYQENIIRIRRLNPNNTSVRI